MTKPFTRQNLRQVRADLILALSKVEIAHGITIEVGGIRFQPDSFRVRLEAKTSATGNTSIDKTDHAKKEFELYAPSFGIKPAVFGTTFSYRGKTYTVCGIKPRSFKFPVLATSDRGKMFKFPATAVGGRGDLFAPCGFDNRHED